jgi:hypothetical protein
MLLDAGFTRKSSIRKNDRETRETFKWPDNWILKNGHLAIINIDKTEELFEDIHWYCFFMITEFGV